MKVRLYPNTELHVLDIVSLLQDGQGLRSQVQARRERGKEVGRREPLLSPQPLRYAHHCFICATPTTLTCVSVALQIDPNKPHWTLRIVTKATVCDSISSGHDDCVLSCWFLPVGQGRARSAQGHRESRRTEKHGAGMGGRAARERQKGQLERGQEARGDLWFKNALTLQAQESRQKFLESWALKDASAPPEEGRCPPQSPCA